MSTPLVVSTRFIQAGPVDVEVESDHGGATERVCALLSQYELPWGYARTRLELRIAGGEKTAGRVPRGGYLRCARFGVDRDGEEYWTVSQAGLTLRYDAAASVARIGLPPPPADTDRETLEELEQLVTFVLMLCWRRLGWTPLHAGSVCSAGGCALLCTHSGGGKSTLVAAMVRRGFKTLGDDKALIHAAPGESPLAAGLARDTNLHPRSAGWFPEVGDLDSLPMYSHWTDKRKLRIEEVWPGCLAPTARPTRIWSVTRTQGGGPVTVTPMEPSRTLEALLRQVVIPTDRGHARATIGVLTALAQTCTGHVVSVPDGAYGRPDATAALEELLR